MSTTNKRFTISVTKDIFDRLNAVKKEQYYDKSQSEMVRDAIEKGLKAIEKKSRK